jgi:hypothetical protein
MCFELGDGGDPIPARAPYARARASGRRVAAFGAALESRWEPGGGEIEPCRALYAHGILGQHVLTELFGNISVREALVGVVIVLVADGRTCALVYKASKA